MIVVSIPHDSKTFSTEVEIAQPQIQIQPYVNDYSYPVQKRLRDLCVEMDSTVSRATTKFE